MQHSSDRLHRHDEMKTQFRAREGYYLLMNSPDYSQRSQRAMGFSSGTANSNSSTACHEKTCIKISLVIINDQEAPSKYNLSTQNSSSPCISSSQSARKINRSKGIRDTKICFNVGRELFVYNYDGVRTGPDASNPIFKRSFKGSSPTCHDFNQTTANPRSISLIVGFSHGQVQIIDLNRCENQESCKEYNSERLIDKTRVTCVKWLPNSISLFLVAHASGHLYLYKSDLPCGQTAPSYQLYKQSDGVAVYTCKTKTTRNPLYKWSIGSPTVDGENYANLCGSFSSLLKFDNECCALNEFVFSPCSKYLACVSQDGFLRVFCYDTMELVGRARSYYGGLTCVCWSPDGKYVVTGGEDDLITVWSFIERRVVARGLGHKSWISVVAFDPFHSGYDLRESDAVNYDDEDEDEREVDERDLVCEEDDDLTHNAQLSRNIENDNCDKISGSESRSPSHHSNRLNIISSPNSISNNKNPQVVKSYRFGSVGQDTQLCLWDLSDDLLQQPIAKPRSNQVNRSDSSCNVICDMSDGNDLQSPAHLIKITQETKPHSYSEQRNLDPNISKSNTLSTMNHSSSKTSSFTKTFSLVGKRDKRSLIQKTTNKNSKTCNRIVKTDNPVLIEDPSKLLGTPICPRMGEVPLIEPTVCKKISFERLTSLIFCQGGFITSCQDGYVYSWARPSKRPTKLSPGQSNDELRVIDVGTSSAV